MRGRFPKTITLFVVALAFPIALGTLPAGATPAGGSSADDLGDGWEIVIEGNDCTDRKVTATHDAAASPEPTTVLKFSVGIDCAIENVVVLDEVSLELVEGDQTSTRETRSLSSAGDDVLALSASWSHNYHHAYTFITDIDPIEAMVAEFETVNGRYWDGDYAWWYDPTCCSGWAYAIAKTWFGWWSPSEPVIDPVDKDNCRSTGTCKTVRTNFTEVYTLTWPWCFGDDRHPTVKHNHIDTNTGRVLTQLPCPPTDGGAARSSPSSITRTSASDSITTAKTGPMTIREETRSSPKSIMTVRAGSLLVAMLWVLVGATAAAALLLPYSVGPALLLLALLGASWGWFRAPSYRTSALPFAAIGAGLTLAILGATSLAQQLRTEFIIGGLSVAATGAVGIRFAGRGPTLDGFLARLLDALLVGICGAILLGVGLGGLILVNIFGLETNGIWYLATAGFFAATGWAMSDFLSAHKDALKVATVVFVVSWLISGLIVGMYLTAGIYDVVVASIVWSATALYYQVALIRRRQTSQT